MGKASRLVEWHLADPVDDEERRRNDIIYSYQQNRNPFIDHPEFVCLIWPDYCNIEPQIGELLISEYIEGTSYNKALEIANITNQSINLDYYILKRQTNGSGNWTSDFPLNGILNPGEVFTLAHTSADPSLTSIANVITGSSILNYNGDDPIALFNNRNLIDVVGTFDAGPVVFGADVTLVRKKSVTDPNTTFTPSST